MSKEGGVSELIGALMIVAVIAAGIGIISVIMISQPPPDKLPSVDFKLNIECPHTDQNLIALTHNRGDSFQVFDDLYSDADAEYYLRVDGKRWNITNKSAIPNGSFLLSKYNSSESGKNFSVGDSLVSHYIGDNAPGLIQFITQDNKGTERLLWSSVDLRSTCSVSSSSSIFNADFYADNRNPCVCTDVHFYDISSTDADDWQWTFEGGTPASASGQGPHTVRYYKAGSYTASLTARNTSSKATDTETKQYYITVNPLIVGFDATPTIGYAPLTVTFTDTSSCFTPGTSEWDFDERNSTLEKTTTGPTAEHKYWDVGVYNVAHTVTDDCGNSETVYKTVTVLCPNVNCDFTITPESGIVSETEFTFQDASTSGRPITTYRYTYNHTTIATDNGIMTPDNQTTETMKFGHPGTYKIQENVCNDCKNTDTQVKSLLVYCPTYYPTFTTDPSPPEGTAPLRVTFTDTTPSSSYYLNRTWYFDDGTTATDSSTTHTFYSQKSLNGTNQYYVTLSKWWTEDCGPYNTTQLVTITCPEVTAQFSSNVTSGDAPLTVNFTDESPSSSDSIITTWNWTFGEGEAPVVLDRTTYTKHIEYTYTSPGNYIVNLTVTNECGSTDTFSNSITVRCPAPHASFTTNPSPARIIPPNSVSFNDTSTGTNITKWYWEFGDDTNYTAFEYDQRNASSHSYPKLGTYLVNLTVTNWCGNSDIYTQEVYVYCPDVEASFTANKTNGEAPLTVLFNDASGRNISWWRWDFGDGSPELNGSIYKQPVHTFEDIGTYIVNMTVWNECGNSDWYTQNITVTCPIVYASFDASPASGYAPLTVAFNDTSTSTAPLTGRTWTFGDGNSSTLRNTSHTYYTPGTYTVNLTASNFCGNATASRQITVLCPPPTAWFTYVVTDYKDFTVQFTDTSESDPFEIVSWLWEFGDGSANSTEINPLHYYGGTPANYAVNLTVTNNCGNSSTVRKILNINCANLTAKANITPTNGTAPLTVYFYDTSNPYINITSWRWIFGDGTYYYTTNASVRNTSHVYSKIGTYYATLIIENECGQGFTYSPIITVTSPGKISGYLWRDLNLNGVKDTTETYLSGWTVYLEQRVGNSWNGIQNMTTGTNGTYNFNINVSSAILRVRETLPTSPAWKVTYSYKSDAENVSGNLPVSEIRNYSNVNFGNVDWHTSQIQIPTYLLYGSSYPGTSLPYPSDWPFNYTTSFDNTVKAMWPPDSTGEKGFLPYVNYSAWGNSSFVFIPGFYNLYYKYGSSSWYWLTSWYWRSNKTIFQTGFNCTVPDNFVYKYSDIQLFYLRNYSTFFEFYYPRENEIISYNKSAYVEVHYVGPNEKQTEGNIDCKLILPNGTKKDLYYNQYWGYSRGYWDNRQWEGQRVMLTAQDKLTTNPISYVNTYRNVTIDWEPLVVTIPSVTSDVSYSSPNYYIKGMTTILANVTGKWRTDNTSLIINNQTEITMTKIANNTVTNTTTFSATINAEDFAGKYYPFFVKAIPLTGHGSTISSVAKYFNAQSKNVLIANFTPDPNYGNATLEVAFTDTSTGGPNKWAWNFADGNISTIQNPYNYFAGTKNYSVTLQVWNASSGPVSVSKWVNVTGKMHEVSLYTTRNGTIPSGKTSKWYTVGSGSSITVNNSTFSPHANETVKILLDSQQDTANILIAGGTITSCNLTNITLIINGTQMTQGNSTSISIPDFLNYHSDMSVSMPANKSSLVDFYWDGTRIPVDYRQKLILYNLMPKTRTDMELDMGSSHVFFTGMASNYTLST